LSAVAIQPPDVQPVMNFATYDRARWYALERSHVVYQHSIFVHILSLVRIHKSVLPKHAVQYYKTITAEENTGENVCPK